MNKKKVNWKFDSFGSRSYNAAGALEAMLINIGMVSFDEQWLIEDMEKFSNRFGVTDEDVHKKLIERFYGKDGHWSHPNATNGLSR